MLDVAPRGDLTTAELKKAYMRCSLHLHPDKNGAADAADAFKRVGVAYEVLTKLAAPLPSGWVAMRRTSKPDEVFYYHVINKKVQMTPP